MPYKSESIRIAGTKYDKRVKLTDDQRKAIIVLIRHGYSQRRVAAMFDVSRRTVQNLIKPQVRKASRKRSTAYNTEAKRKYRRRKQRLFMDGKIK